MNSIRTCCHFLSCAGLPNGVNGEDGVSLSDRRTGRRGKRQKNSTKLVDGKYQPLPSDKEIVEAGQVKLKDSPRGEGSKLIFFPLKIISLLKLIVTPLCESAPCGNMWKYLFPLVFAIHLFIYYVFFSVCYSSKSTIET